MTDEPIIGKVKTVKLRNQASKDRNTDINSTWFEIVKIIDGLDFEDRGITIDLYDDTDFTDDTYSYNGTIETFEEYSQICQIAIKNLMHRYQEKTGDKKRQNSWSS